jgi:hypothetical protein
MKAAVYDNPGPPIVLRYADVPDPVCGPADVLIAVEAIWIEGGDLVNPRSMGWRQCDPQKPARTLTAPEVSPSERWWKETIDQGLFIVHGKRRPIVEQLPKIHPGHRLVVIDPKEHCVGLAAEGAG